MPPRKKETDEEKERKFTAWKEGPEFAILKKFAEIRANNQEAAKIEVASNDISAEWKDVLKGFYEVLETLKVPKKSKGKFDLIFVTVMFRV